MGNYERKLRLAKEALESGSYDKETIEYIFPELKESEDEKIRKELLSFCQNRADNYPNDPKYANIGNWIAWLEKQGEKPQGKTELEAIKEEKVDNANKIEPKFHEGEWVVWDNKISCHIDNIYQVKESLMYAVTDTNNMIRTYSGKDFDRNAHLWTLNDAKDGDVLACNEEILLFKSYSVQGRISLYCWYNGQTNNFYSKEVDDVLVTTRNKIYPATKEQRDALFVEMREEGYEWDAEKKVLKKIRQKQAIDYIDSLIDSHPKDNWELVHEFLEKFGRIPEDEDELNVLVEYVLKRQKPTEWGEEDEEKFRDVIRLIEQGAPVQSIRDHYTNWLKSIKDRVARETSYTTAKEWSESDEEEFQIAIDTLVEAGQRDSAHWLESIKDRVQPHWKPSGEQIDAFEHFVKSIGESGFAYPHNHNTKCVYSLLNDLKKL